MDYCRHSQLRKAAWLTATAIVSTGSGNSSDAAEKLRLGVGGYFYSAYGYVNEDDGNGEAGHNHYNHALNQDNEIHFKGETTLDNGVIVGARIDMEGFTSDDQIDERWVSFEGGFGQLRYGDEDDARFLMSYAAPNPTHIFGVNTPYFTFNNAGPNQVATTVSTFRTDFADAARLIYFTPTVLGGLQLAASYAPDGAQDRTGFGTPPSNDCNQASKQWSVGAGYAGEIAGLTVSGGGGYSAADREDGGGCDKGADPWIGAVGMNIGFGNFTVGGSLLIADNLDFSPGGNTEFDVGATYAFDAWTVGLDWGHGIYDHSDDTDTLDQAQLGASYALGPGIAVEGMIGYFRYDAETGPNNTGWQTAIGSALDF